MCFLDESAKTPIYGTTNAYCVKKPIWLKHLAALDDKGSYKKQKYTKTWNFFYKDPKQNAIYWTLQWWDELQVQSGTIGKYSNKFWPCPYTTAVSPFALSFARVRRQRWSSLLNWLSTKVVVNKGICMRNKRKYGQKACGMKYKPKLYVNRAWLTSRPLWHFALSAQLSTVHDKINTHLFWTN